MKKDKNFYALILAGGLGSRFWPASKESLPKQFINLTGSGKTLIKRHLLEFKKSSRLKIFLFQRMKNTKTWY